MAQHAALPRSSTSISRRHVLSTESPADRAKARAQARFHHGQDAVNALLDRVAAMIIRDRLAFPQSTTFLVDDNGPPTLCIQYEKDPTKYKVHRHALAQLATRVDLPIAFARQLDTSGEKWRMDLLATNLNVLFHKSPLVDGKGIPVRFLHRTVGTELRGFVSRKFRRHLASQPLLQAFVEASTQCFARPVEASASDVRFSLKCFVPEVFEAFPGQFLCVGTEWTNSDFGMGRMAIRQTVWDPLRDTRAVIDLDHSVSKVHLGSIIEDSDLEMSDETAAREVDALASAIRDSVHAQLEADTIERLLETIRRAHEQQIPWPQLRAHLGAIVGRKDLATLEEWLSKAVIELPPPGRNAAGQPIPTRWWAASAVSALATHSDDDERIAELEREAGRLLAGMKGNPS